LINDLHPGINNNNDHEAHLLTINSSVDPNIDPSGDKRIPITDNSFVGCREKKDIDNFTIECIAATDISKTCDIANITKFIYTAPYECNTENIPCIDPDDLNKISTSNITDLACTGIPVLDPRPRKKILTAKKLFPLNPLNSENKTPPPEWTKNYEPYYHPATEQDHALEFHLYTVGDGKGYFTDWSDDNGYYKAWCGCLKVNNEVHCYARGGGFCFKRRFNDDAGGTPMDNNWQSLTDKNECENRKNTNQFPMLFENR